MAWPPLVRSVTLPTCTCRRLRQQRVGSAIAAGAVIVGTPSPSPSANQHPHRLATGRRHLHRTVAAGPLPTSQSSARRQLRTTHALAVKRSFHYQVNDNWIFSTNCSLYGRCRDCNLPALRQQPRTTLAASLQFSNWRLAVRSRPPRGASHTLRVSSRRPYTWSSVPSPLRPPFPKGPPAGQMPRPRPCKARPS